MKTKLVLSASLFAIVAALSAGAQAASDADKAAETKPATADAPAAKAAPTKPHSHVQEKTGMPQPVPDEKKADKPNPATDTTKHFHPRDMK